MIVMNKFILLFGALFLCIGVVIGQSKHKSTGAEISSPETDFDFGVIKEANGKVSHVFTIKNTGTAPLVIAKVQPSCGCANPEYSKEPVAPGKDTKIKITFDPAGRPGPFTKTIAIYSNGRDGAFILRIKGKVE